MYGSILLLIGATTPIIITILIFSTTQLVLQTMFGYKMYVSFKTRRKRTIYDFRSINTDFGFGSIAILVFNYVNWSTLSSSDLLWTLVWLALLFAPSFIGVHYLCKDQNSPYPYRKHAYFDKFVASSDIDIQ